MTPQIMPPNKSPAPTAVLSDRSFGPKAVGAISNPRSCGWRKSRIGGGSAFFVRPTRPTMTSTSHLRQFLGVLAVGTTTLVSCSETPTIPSANGGQSKRELLAAWRASNTPIGLRLSVAQSLLTTNMHTDQVEAMLGEPTMRYRHNPGIPAGAPPGTEQPRIYWWYDYRFKDGTVVVNFLQVMNASRFEAELQSVGLGNTGTVQMISFPPTNSQSTSR
jgi:hypothetical protein